VIPEMPTLFFEIHDGLPRQGPGSFDSTAKAFGMITDLPERPRILDLGCGPGMQTLALAKLTDAEIIAVDTYQPFLDQLSRKAQAEGVADRIQPLNADMHRLTFPAESFDLIWAEASIYLMGFAKGLEQWKRFLKKGGCLAVSEVSWLRDDPPEEIRRFWNTEYPQIQTIDANLQVIEETGYESIGYFVLPSSDWWEHYYEPIAQRLEDFRRKYAGSPQDLEIIAMEQNEIEMYRKYSDSYGYVFYVMRMR